MSHNVVQLLIHEPLFSLLLLFVVPSFFLRTARDSFVFCYFPGGVACSLVFRCPFRPAPRPNWHGKNPLARGPDCAASGHGCCRCSRAAFGFPPSLATLSLLCEPLLRPKRPAHAVTHRSPWHIAWTGATPAVPRLAKNCRLARGRHASVAKTRCVWHERRTTTSNLR